MSKDKINGSFIKNIKRESPKELIITLKNREKLRLYSITTDYGYDSEIKIEKITPENNSNDW